MESYSEALFNRSILTFHYSSVGLPDLPADEYRALDNPPGPALSALMRPSHLAPALQKAQSLQRTFASSIDDARKSLLAYIIETYTVLNQEEHNSFLRLFAQDSFRETRDMINIYEQRGEARGILKGKLDMLRLQLTHKFGRLSEAIESTISGLNTETELDALSEQVLDARSAIDAIGLFERGD